MPALYVLLLLIPSVWLITASFQTNADIAGGAALIPQNPPWRNYHVIFSDPTWYLAYFDSLIYVFLNVALSITVALPAAYAFSRYRFLGDSQMFFWFLASRMEPAALFVVPLVQVFSEFSLIDTHIAVALAHCLFNVPIAIWILEGFISAVPGELDETAWIDGYSKFRFFRKILLPLIAPGIGVTAFFCFLFSWVELLLASALTTIHAKPIGAIMTRAGGLLGGLNVGLLAAASVLTLIPGVILVYFVRHHIARGFSLGQVK